MKSINMATSQLDLILRRVDIKDLFSSKVDKEFRHKDSTEYLKKKDLEVGGVYLTKSGDNFLYLGSVVKEESISTNSYKVINHREGLGFVQVWNISDQVDITDNNVKFLKSIKRDLIEKVYEYDLPKIIPIHVRRSVFGDLKKIEIILKEI